MRLLFSMLLLFCIAFTACRKSDEITTDQSAKLSFSTDTILFDTVFTTVGSANRRVKVYNTNQKGINISHIKLSGGASSNFNLIINGQPVNEKTDMQIGGKDSISIFVKVTINPNNQSQPFIVQDSILFNTNGNPQSVALIAYGQNAVFINNQVVSSNTSWTKTLPYIIYKSVTVAAGVTLNIQAGTKVFFHGNSGMHIKGTLHAEGTPANPVVFGSDRLENIYADEAGQWDGIRFYSGNSASSINYGIIKNAIIGLWADSVSVNNGPKLLLTNSTVKNMEVAGFSGYGTGLNAFNNLFFNCGQFLLYGVGGGRYNLKHNTFAGYNFNFPRKTAAVYLCDLGPGNLWGDLQADLANNIIWGSLTEEFLIDKKTNAVVDADVRNNLIKTALQTYDANFNILNADPGFINPARDNYELLENSPALNKGADLSTDPYFSWFLNKDINNKSRSFPSDLGCYEHN